MRYNTASGISGPVREASLSVSTDELAGVPWGLKAVNGVGRTLARLGLGRGGLDADGAMKAARKATGLHDLGEDDGWVEGMRTLVSSLESEGGLSFVGRHAMNVELQRIFTQRLRIEDELARHPEILDRPVERPVFVLGFPRTGTTVLHNLLACDGRARAPRMWELLRPSPAPDPSGPQPDPRVPALQAEIAKVHKAVPDLLRIHPLDPTGPDECFYVFGLAFRGRTADAQAPCPTYMRWVRDQDLRPAYRYYRRVLQLLSWKSPGRYWVLKAPTHLWHLDALLDVFPDARVVQTHRDPRQVAGSCCSLYEVTRQLFTDDPQPLQIGESWLETWGVAMERALAVRDARPEASFTDVRFSELVRDAAAAALSLLSRLGVEPTAGTEARMRAWLDAHARDRHGSHSFSLERYGLDAVAVGRRFDGYIRRFDLAPPGP